MDKMQLDRELLEKYVSDGLTQTEIANRLYVSQQTLKTVWNTSQTREKECLQYRAAEEIHTYRND